MNYAVFVSTVLLAIHDLNDPDGNVWKAWSGSLGAKVEFLVSNIVHLAPLGYLPVYFFVVSAMVRCVPFAAGSGQQHL